MANNWYEKAREIAQNKRISHAEIAAGVGISPSAISHYFLGRRRPRDLSMIKKIARVLEVPPLELLEEDIDIVRNDEESALLQQFRALEPDQAELLLRLLADMAQRGQSEGAP